MRLPMVFLPLLLLLGCTPVQTVAVAHARIPKGSGITLQVFGPDPAGVEHALSQALLRTGFQPHSSAVSTVLVSQPGSERAAAEPLVDQEITRRFLTPYLCRLKMTGSGTRVWSFNLQVIDVSNGKILVSAHGSQGGYDPEEIVSALMQQLERMAS